MAMQTGIMSPPPPIPPLFAKPSSRGRIIAPPISDHVAGNTSLCAQMLFWHCWNAELMQSET